MGLGLGLGRTHEQEPTQFVIWNEIFSANVTVFPLDENSNCKVFSHIGDVPCSVPFLHMEDSVVRKLKETKLKPLEHGNPLRIGVLATNATLASVSQETLCQHELRRLSTLSSFNIAKIKEEFYLGFEVVLPDRATMEGTMIPAIEALNRKNMEGAYNLLRVALQVLLVRAVNSVMDASMICGIDCPKMILFSENVLIQ
ncbi:hypothetical protein VNO77_06283 [Canavalia gladiata]|uniref:Uncharacterized protein n=1 Tax=Canavalia gladiata TaxID=3824 RepID=A0AAN9MBZ0_CANGL